MKKELLNKIAKAKENPVFEGLSEELKDPDNFQKIEKKIVNTMVSDHKHANIKQFINCKRCQDKVRKKAETIKKSGFKDFTQYQNWKKIMFIMINKKNLRLYEKN